MLSYDTTQGGHRIFKYRLSSNPGPDWKYKSISTLANDCFLGLIFGETEETIYFFGMNAGKAVLTRM